MSEYKTLDRQNLLLKMLVLLIAFRLLSLAFYPLMDTTEARYAEIARKMYTLGDWVTPWFDYGVPFWGKPPLSFWLTAGSFEIFGVNEFAARFPHWLCGIIVGFFVWKLAMQYSRSYAIYAVMLLSGGLLFLISSGAVMTDMSLTLGTSMSMYGFWMTIRKYRSRRLSGQVLFFSGLAVGLLAKGPIAIILVCTPIGLWSLLTGNFAHAWRSFHWVYGTLLMLLIVSPWYVLAEIRTPGFIEYFLYGEHWQRFVTSGWQGDLYGSAHDYPRGTIWGFLLIDLLPWTILLPLLALLLKFKRVTENTGCETPKQWRYFLLIWGLFPAVFFTMAGNILWPYVLPGVPALALLGADWLVRRNHQELIEKILLIGVSFSALLTLIFPIFLVFSDLDERRSAKFLVSLFRQQGKDSVLYFYGRKPFSADFYSSGNAILISDVSGLKRINNKNAYVAIKTGAAHKLPPSLINRYTQVDSRGELILLKYTGSSDLGNQLEQKYVQPQ